MKLKFQMSVVLLYFKSWAFLLIQKYDYMDRKLSLQNNLLHLLCCVRSWVHLSELFPGISSYFSNSAHIHFPILRRKKIINVFASWDRLMKCSRERLMALRFHQRWHVSRIIHAWWVNWGIVSLRKLSVWYAESLKISIHRWVQVKSSQVKCFNFMFSPVIVLMVRFENRSHRQFLSNLSHNFPIKLFFFHSWIS